MTIAQSQIKCASCEIRSYHLGLESPDLSPPFKDLNQNEKESRIHFQKREIVEVSWNPTWEPEVLQNACESFRQSLNKFEGHIGAPNLSQPSPDEHLNDLENKGSLPSKRELSTNPTMLIFGTKLALTSNPPTHRLTFRPRGIVITGSQPLISWSIEKRVPYPPQMMALCFLKCTLTQ